MTTKSVSIGLLLLVAAFGVNAYWWGDGRWGGGNWGGGGWGGNYNSGVFGGGGGNYWGGPYWGGYHGWSNNNYWGGGNYWHPLNQGGGRGSRWWDVSDSAKVNDAKTACIAFIEQFADAALPADKIDAYVSRKFLNLTASSGQVQQPPRMRRARMESEKPEEDKSAQLAPFVFQCCHVLYGKELLMDPMSAAALDYMAPPLPAGATCQTLVEELYRQLSGKIA